MPSVAAASATGGSAVRQIDRGVTAARRRRRPRDGGVHHLPGDALPDRRLVLPGAVRDRPRRRRLRGRLGGSSAVPRHRPARRHGRRSCSTCWCATAAARPTSGSCRAAAPWTASPTSCPPGSRDIARYAAPIAVSPGVELLAVGGVGLVALAVDTLAVTLRRAALAGLPLLALYTVPTSVAARRRQLGGLRPRRRSASSPCCSPRPASASAAGAGRCATPPQRPNYRPDVETGAAGAGRPPGRRDGARPRARRARGAARPGRRPVWASAAAGSASGRGGNQVSVVNPILDLGQDLRRSEQPGRCSATGDGRPTCGSWGWTSFDGRPVAPQRAARLARGQRRRGRAARRRRASVATSSGPRRRYGIDVFQPRPDAGCRCRTRPSGSRSTGPGSTTRTPSTSSARTRRRSTSATTCRALDVRPTPEQLRDAGEAPDSARPLPPAADGPAPRRGRADARKQSATTPTTTTRRWRCRTGCGPATSPTPPRSQDTVGDTNGSEACLRLPGHPRGLLRALRVDDGGDGPAARHPRPGGRRLHRRDLGRLREPAGRAARRARLAGALLRGRRLGGLRADARPSAPGNPPPWTQPDSPTRARTRSRHRGASSPPATGDARSGRPVSAPTSRVCSTSPPVVAAAGSAPAAVRVPVVPLLIGVGILLLLAVPSLTRLVVRRRRWARGATPAEQAAAPRGPTCRTACVDHGYGWQSSDSPRRGIAAAAGGQSAPEGAAAAGRTPSGERDRAGPLRPGDARRRRRPAGRRGRAAPRLAARPRPVGPAGGPACCRRSTRSVSTAISERFADAAGRRGPRAGRVTRRLRPGRS